MGAADGPQFAPARPGSKPIISAPCGCPECVAGPGLDPIARSEERLNRLLGPVTSVECWDWCPQCQHTVRTKSVKTRVARTWDNTCEHNHRWKSFD